MPSLPDTLDAVPPHASSRVALCPVNPITWGRPVARAEQQLRGRVTRLGAHGAHRPPTAARRSAQASVPRGVPRTTANVIAYRASLFGRNLAEDLPPGRHSRQICATWTPQAPRPCIRGYNRLEHFRWVMCLGRAAPGSVRQPLGRRPPLVWAIMQAWAGPDATYVRFKSHGGVHAQPDPPSRSPAARGRSRRIVHAARPAPRSPAPCRPVRPALCVLEGAHSVGAVP